MRRTELENAARAWIRLLDENERKRIRGEWHPNVNSVDQYMRRLRRLMRAARAVT